jgi:hypothetical protein
MNIRRLLNFLLCAGLLWLGFSSQPVKAQPVSEEIRQSDLNLPASEIKGDIIQDWGDEFRLGVGYINGDLAGVFALAKDSGDLYVGGDFDYAGSMEASHIARWDGSKWYALGSGINNRVYAIAVSSDYVYAGGIFNLAGGLSVSSLARWNKNTNLWSALGNFENGVYSPEIDALAVATNGDLYVGGEFLSVDGVSANNVAYYSNTTGWHALGSGISCSPTPCSSSVNALLVNGSTVYAGGDFNVAGGFGVNNLAKWNGSSWSSVGGGVGGSYHTVDALGINGSNLYVAGEFSEVNPGGTPITASNVAFWTGSTWNTMSGGVNSNVYSLVIRADGVYIGGRFNTAGPIDAANVARWDGSTWQVLKNSTETLDGVDDNMYALAADGNAIYMGGYFTSAGENTANHIAAFTSGKWNSLGDSVSGLVRVLYSTDNGYDSSGYIYAGGSFKSSGGISQFRLARWNSNSKSWYAITNGADISGCHGILCSPSVRTIYSDDQYLYIGGNFTSVGGVAVSGIARFNWNTWTWSNMGNGMTGSLPSDTVTVYDILAVGSNIYAAGYFDNAGGTTVNNIAEWNGTSWLPIQDFSNPGTNGTVFSLSLLSNGNIAVGGSFTIPGLYIAGWNGVNWYTPGNGLNGPVYTMIGDGSANNPLYIGGSFTSPSHIARLSGSSWVGMGSGFDGIVYDLARDPAGNLYAGGSFLSTGILGVSHVAKWDGSAWSNLGMGTDDTVYTLTYADGWLYAGGPFLNAGSQPSVYMARWGIPYPLFLPVIKR